MKRFATLLLALAILFSLAVPAFADETATSKITINAGNGVTSLAGRSFAAYKLLDAQKTIGYEQDENGTYYQQADGTFSTTEPAGVDNPTKYKQVDRYVYTVADAWKAFFTSADFAKENNAPKFTGNEPDFHAQVVNYIQNLGHATDDPDNTNALFAFAQAALEWAANKTVTADAVITKNTDAQKAEFTNLPAGYYLIADTTLSDTETEGEDGTTTPGTNLNAGEAVSALMLGTTDVEVTIKSEVTTVEKNIIDGTEVKYTNGAIGDCVEFKITTKVPDMLGYQEYTFTIHDTMSKGLTFDEKIACSTCQLGNGGTAHSHAVKVTVGTGDSAVILTELTDAQSNTNQNVYTMSETANADGTTKITIDFPYIFEAGWQSGAPINVTYYALIDENAAFISTGIPNEVKVEYSNDPTDLGDGGTDNPKHPTGETPPSKVEVFYGEINLLKVDESNNTLAGAKFKLEGDVLNQSRVTDFYYGKDENGTHWALKDGTFTTTTPTEDTKGDYLSTTDKYSLKNTSHLVTADTTATPVITAEVDTDGKLSFEGLKAGEYVITEIESPDGYNLLLKPIYVKLDVTVTKNDADDDYTAGWSLYEAVYDENGDPQKTDNKITYSETAVGNLTITVVNKAGLELPSTGGMGTTLFYVVGAGLMLAAIVLLVAKKRAAN